MDRRKENRLVVINEEGIVCELWNVEIEESIQDDGRTLKLFVKEK